MNFMNNYYLSHHGIKGQKWGVRRYQNEDGTLTEEGKKRKRRNIAIGVGVTAAAAALTAGVILKNKAIKSEGDDFIRSLYKTKVMKVPVKKFVSDNAKNGKKYVKSLATSVKEGAKEAIKESPMRLGKGVKEGVGAAFENTPKKIIPWVALGAGVYGTGKFLDKHISKEVAAEFRKQAKPKK